MSSEIAKKKLHPQAAELAKLRITSFALALIYQAKLLAYRRDAEEVLSNDVKEALELMTRQHGVVWQNQLLIVIGGAVIGVFVQGFVNELTSGNATLMGVYTVIGFIGMLLVFWALRR